MSPRHTVLQFGLFHLVYLNIMAVQLLGPIGMISGCYILFRFVPRHKDEIELVVGDELVLNRLHPDLWAECKNKRTGETGVVPNHYIAHFNGENPGIKLAFLKETFRWVLTILRLPIVHLMVYLFSINRSHMLSIDDPVSIVLG